MERETAKINKRAMQHLRRPKGFKNGNPNQTTAKVEAEKKDDKQPKENNFQDFSKT